MSKVTTEHMTWHQRHYTSYGDIVHPVDGDDWKQFDKKHGSFVQEPRNVRLGLCSDGFNPFGQGSNLIHVGQFFRLHTICLLGCA